MSRLLWTMILVSLQLFAVPAEAVTRELTLCLEYRKDFDDEGAGDWWTDNDDNAKALGVEVTITDDLVSHLRNLSDDTGCTTLDVEVSGVASVVVRAISRSEVEGIEIESYKQGKYWEDQHVKVEAWTVLVPGSTNEVMKELPLKQVWVNLAVAGWMMNRNDFRLGTGTGRTCCLETSTGYQKDGTCTSGDYGTIQPPIRLFAHNSHGCGGSSIDDQDTPPGVHPALAVDNGGCMSKFVLAHELGHVIVGMRQGGKELGQYPLTAPLDSCMGNYRDAAGTQPIDTGGPARGVFTKEFMSLAMREGWANFVAAWAWNRRVETDCVFSHRGVYADFDLDGTIDNDFADTAAFEDRWFDCRGTPFLGSNSPNPMDARNWLEDLQDTNYTNHCDRETIADHEANRSTVYDVAKMFWELTSADGYDLNPRVLADLYVDMCARGWAEADDDATPPGDTAYVEDDLPLERLYLSADANNIDTAVEAAAGAHLEH